MMKKTMPPGWVSGIISGILVCKPGQFILLNNYSVKVSKTTTTAIQKFIYLLVYLRRRKSKVRNTCDKPFSNCSRAEIVAYLTSCTNRVHFVALKILFVKKE